MKVHQLWNIIDRGLDLSGAIDRNTLTKSINYVTASIKIIDYGTICPIRKKPINVYYNTSEVDSNILIQLRDWCFPLKMIIGQESKTAFLEFEDFYQFMTDLSTENDNGNNNLREHIQSMNISRCADMVAHQKALNRGGACKVKKLFCYCCPTTSDECVKSKDVPCEKFCQNWDSNWRCYHKQFTHPSDMESYQDMIN